MTVKEIIEKLEENDISVSAFAYCDFDSKELGLGEFKEVEQKGGEDEGSEWYSIKYFKDHDVYIMTQGYYQSHYGTDFDYGYGEEVKPKEKIVIVYE